MRSDFEKIRRAEGEKLCAAVGVHNLPNEIVETLGRFKWRFSYGQNLLQHTEEEINNVSLEYLNEFMEAIMNLHKFPESSSKIELAKERIQKMRELKDANASANQR